MNSALLDFKCDKNKDIENFLHNKAISYQKQSRCSVYLLCDEKAFFENIISIQAYFTLSHKSIVIPAADETVSKSQRDAIMKNRNAESLEFVLIGQLGKRIENVGNDDFIYSEISGEEILKSAKEVINAANELIACRAVLVECEDEEKINKFYKTNGFKFLQKDRYNQYYYILK